MNSGRGTAAESSAGSKPDFDPAIRQRDQSARGKFELNSAAHDAMRGDKIEIEGPK